jgi:DNA-binding NarL/FixJ family response regulator
MSVTAADVIPAPRSAKPARAMPSLSERERELLARLADGWSTAQIARAMSVSTNTARTRIRRVSSKLAVRGRLKIAQAARALGTA